MRKLIGLMIVILIGSFSSVAFISDSPPITQDEINIDVGIDHFEMIDLTVSETVYVTLNKKDLIDTGDSNVEIDKVDMTAIINLHLIEFYNETEKVNPYCDYLFQLKERDIEYFTDTFLSKFDNRNQVPIRV